MSLVWIQSVSGGNVNPALRPVRAVHLNEGIRHFGFAAGDIVIQRIFGAGIKGGLLVIAQHLGDRKSVV